MEVHIYARVVSGSVPLEELEEAIQLWRSTVAVSVPQQKGFQSARLLVDRASGRIMSVGFWETQPDVQGTSQLNRNQVARFAGLFSSPPTAEEHFEVAVEV
jgi:hypothetical protein